MKVSGANRAVPYGILALSLVATGAATYVVRAASAARDLVRFESLVESTEARIRNRMEMYVALLRATRGLFESSPHVSREEFRTFVERLDVQRNYPGVQGIGFSRRMRPEERRAVTAGVRRGWRPDFQIRPESRRPEYHAIIYLEPQDRRNQVAIGYDMSSEPVRRAAMERARDAGEPAASGKVTLVQEIDQKKQSGFLLYVPLYRRGVPISTVAQRRAALLGFAYSPFRVDDLMAGVIGRDDEQLAFEVFAGTTAAGGALLHRAGHPDQDGYQARLKVTRRIELAGFWWTIAYSDRPGFVAASTAGQARLAGLSGLAISILIFLVALSQARARSATESVARGLAKSEAAIRETERLKTEFMANVSHELRTPLTLALAPLESLIGGEYGAMGRRQSDALGSIHNNVLRLLQLVTSLLDFSRLEAGKVEVQRSALPLVIVTRAVLADFHAFAESRGVAIGVDLPGEEIVALDRYLYERILFNLVSNAIKFTPKGGRVTVEVRWAAGRVRLRVADTGCGISAAALADLFQRFRQVEGSLTRRFEGTGLGLALVREFARRLGGDVSVESVAGRGSVFTADFDAPATGDAVNEEEAARRSSMVEKYVSTSAPGAVRPNGEDRLKVLIAEDNGELRGYIAELLQDSYELWLARDGQEALDAALRWSPDLVVSDVMMPKGDGLSLCRELKARQETADVPVVLLTALTQRDALFKGWEAGADEYLFKPFHPNELRTRVRSLLISAQARKKAEKIAAQTQKMAAVGQLAAGVAHDFNNILTSILGTAHLLRETGELSESLRPDLEVIISESGRAAQLVSQLLDFARQSPPARRSIDLSALLSETRGLLQRSLPANINVVVESPEAPIRVRANASKLQQVLLNLGLNARDAMLKGGELRFSLRSLSIGVGERGPFEGMRGEWAALAVSDQGCGMSEEALRHAFEPFFTTKGLAKGTGLGLAQAYATVKQHEGHVEVASAAGRGTTFTIYLPQIAEDADEGAPRPRGSEGGRGETLLLVEDEAAVRDLASRVLRQSGYKVIEACAAAEAIELLRKTNRPIDLLLTDVIMPGLNGRQLAERLEEQRPGLRVMYMSGYTSGIVGEDGVLGREEPLLRKPFTPEELVARVRFAFAPHSEPRLLPCASPQALVAKAKRQEAEGVVSQYNDSRH
ncbi:MAG: CHASE domain-containing protein [Elusimicrobia bacterium]|nr:CHASE domain-containing protein [Elusimicrobiota bacterium]